MKNDRLRALKILLQVLEHQTPLTHIFQKNADISSLTKAICFGVCRHYFRLQAITDSLVKKRPQMDVWVILLMGIYQLHYLNKPEYATVKETVDLLDAVKKSWAKGLVNAVLRGFCRERTAILEKLSQQPMFIYGHPNWFIKRIKQDWPLDWEAILIGNDTHPPMSLRVNQRLSTRDDYLEILKSAGIAAQALEHSPSGIILDTPCDVTQLPGFIEGQISVQDQAAQLAVLLLDLKPGLRVLDACCAPGGKTCHILESEPDLAECVAVDVDEQRLNRVRENLQRLNLNATVIQGDALQPAVWWKKEELFDRILLDAPCSATGVIRRHPDIKLLRTAEDIKVIAELQASLLQSLWLILKPGGRLVYATCSVMKAENEEQIANFIASHSNCQLASGNAWGKQTEHGWQLFPGQDNCDGFFYSVLLKQE